MRSGRAGASKKMGRSVAETPTEVRFEHSGETKSRETAGAKPRVAGWGSINASGEQQ
jgi:hypothetical protein